MNYRPTSMPSVAIHTHGCKLNQADSSLLASQFLAAGYQLVDSEAEADVLVLNTCTVTSTADAKARQALRTARRRNPNAIIVATGCYAQRAAQDLRLLDAVSLVVGNTEKQDLVSLVNTFGQVARQPAGDSRLAESRFQVPQSRETRPPIIGNVGRLRAMIKIQEGCNQVCSYCIVPKVRGRERSIHPDSLVEQVNQYVAAGGQEVVLTGTQLGTYGFDLPGADLSTLLRRLLNETPVTRIRVSSLQPQEISSELLDLWGNNRLCPHFHVPLQSGCNSILKAMRRRYDTARFTRTIGLIRQTIADAAITTDLIVGFPGEGDPEFRESLRFVDTIGFSDMHVFPYSARPGTSAA